MLNSSCAPAPTSGGAPPLRLVVFAARRTGSSWLAEMLRRHPQVLMHGEIFHIQLENARDREDGFVGSAMPEDKVFLARRRQPQGLLDFVACNADGRRVVGFKIFRDHLRPTSWHLVMNWCNVCVILRRHDVRAQYGSLLRARASGQWKGITSQRAHAASGGGGSAIAIHSNSSSSSSSSSRRRGEDDGFSAWRKNQAGWYQTVTSQLGRAARSTPSKVVLEFTYEQHLAKRGGGPQLSPLWRALGVGEPPPS